MVRWIGRWYIWDNAKEVNLKACDCTRRADIKEPEHGATSRREREKTMMSLSFKSVSAISHTHCYESYVIYLNKSLRKLRKPEEGPKLGNYIHIGRH